MLGRRGDSPHDHRQLTVGQRAPLVADNSHRVLVAHPGGTVAVNVV